MSAKNIKPWNDLLSLKLVNLLFGIGCFSAKIDTAYLSDYDDVTERYTPVFYTEQFVPDPLGLSFESGGPEATTEFSKKSEDWITDPTAYLVTKKKSAKVRRVVKKNPTVLTATYQRTFDKKYPRRLKNYSEIFPGVREPSVVPKRRMFTSSTYNFASFPSLTEIYEYLTVLETLSKGRAAIIPLQYYNSKWITVHTNLRNEILSIRISTNPVRAHEENSIIVVVAGIHGSDWYAIQSAIFAAERLILDEDVDVNEDFDWWIVPVLNPDGYEISHDTPDWRNWKKNLQGIRDLRDDECFGVDLDFAFEYQWLSCNASRCDSNFPGEAPFTVPEALGLRDTLEAFSAILDSFVALKEGRQSLVYPFSDTFQSPPHLRSIEKVAKDAAEFFGEHVESVYDYGQSSQVIETRAGFIEDWAKIHLGVEKSFAFYLGPTEKDRRELRHQHLMDHMNGTFEVLKIIAKTTISRKIENSSSDLDLSFACVLLYSFAVFIDKK